MGGEKEGGVRAAVDVTDPTGALHSGHQGFTPCGQGVRAHTHPRHLPHPVVRLEDEDRHRAVRVVWWRDAVGRLHRRKVAHGLGGDAGGYRDAEPARGCAPGLRLRLPRAREDVRSARRRGRPPRGRGTTSGHRATLRAPTRRPLPDATSGAMKVTQSARPSQPGQPAAESADPTNLCRRGLPPPERGGPGVEARGVMWRPAFATPNSRPAHGALPAATRCFTARADRIRSDLIRTLQPRSLAGRAPRGSAQANTAESERWPLRQRAFGARCRDARTVRGGDRCAHPWSPSALFLPQPAAHARGAGCAPSCPHSGLARRQAEKYGRPRASFPGCVQAQIDLPARRWLPVLRQRLRTTRPSHLRRLPVGQSRYHDGCCARDGQPYFQIGVCACPI
eukprot:scaffold2872_cov112-Isochrysis_galbana.AAC.20